MMRYQVRARRVDGWWALDFDVDRRIHSQVRRLDQAADAAADAITLWFADEDGRQVSAADVVVEPVLDDDLSEVSEVVELRHQAAELSEEAQRRMRVTIGRCLARGFTTRDIGTLLGVSHQYVAKVAKEDALV